MIRVRGHSITRLAARGIFILLALAAMAVFVELNSASFITWSQSYLHESFWFKLLGAFEMFILFPGLAPLMVAIYFFAVVDDLEVNLYGVFFVALFSAAHFLTSAVAMHSSMALYLPVQLVELAAAVLIIVYHRKRRQRRQVT